MGVLGKESRMDLETLSAATATKPALPKSTDTTTAKPKHLATRPKSGPGPGSRPGSRAATPSSAGYPGTGITMLRRI